MSYNFYPFPRFGFLLTQLFRWVQPFCEDTMPEPDKQFFNKPARLYSDSSISISTPAETIESFRCALAAGADALSVYLRMTDDGALSVAGGENGGNPVMAVEDFLSVFSDVKSMMHLKGETPSFVRKLCDSLICHDAVSRVIVGMSDPGCMEILRRRIPECATLCTPGETFRAILLSKTGLIVLKKNFSGDLILVPEYAAGVRIIVPSFVKEMRVRGVRLSALFPDGEKAMKRLVEAGVDSFVTDDASALKATL